MFDLLHGNLPSEQSVPCALCVWNVLGLELEHLMSSHSLISIFILILNELFNVTKPQSPYLYIRRLVTLALPNSHSCCEDYMNHCSWKHFVKCKSVYTCVGFGPWRLMQGLDLAQLLIHGVKFGQLLNLSASQFFNIYKIEIILLLLCRLIFRILWYNACE